MAPRVAIAVFVAAVACTAHAARLDSDLNTLNGDREWKERPIAKVVGMLKDMQAQLEVEAKEDEEMYDSMVCWCETGIKDKTKSIADGQQKMKELAATIEESTASSQQLDTDIKALGVSVEECTKALAEAEEVRAKELAEFNAEEKDTIQSLSSLKGAITSLSKANAGSSLAQRQALIQVRQALSRQPAEAVSALLPHQRRVARAFIEQPDMALLQESSSLRATQPASGAIFGMLNQMKESFETNIETSKQEEAKSAAEYEQLKAAKESEVTASKGKIETKKTELAKAKETKARSEEDLDGTEDAVAADTEFLKNVKSQCGSLEAEYEARTKARQEEITAVGETIGILTSDEANDAMTKSMTLLQARAQSKSELKAREAAAAFLSDAGQRLRSPRISYLAVRVKNDAFAKIKENIDGMVVQLDHEQKDEVVKKDDCRDDLNTNEKQTGERNEHKTDVETEINDVESEIKGLTDEEMALKEEIAKTQIAMKGASEDREKENKDFQVTVSDQRATQAILDKALKRMQEVYDKKAAAASLVQEDGDDSLLQVKRARRAAQTPPKFEKMEKNAGGGGVLTMLQGIIDESKAVEKDAISAETDAQDAYEIFVGDSNKQIETLQKQLVNDDEILAKDNQIDVEDKGDRSATVNDILKLGEVGQTLHGACDFTIDNFDTRQHARADEMDALKESKMIFGSF